MKDAILALTVLGVVVTSFLNLKPTVTVKEVVREVPVVKERVVVKRIVNTVVKERPVSYTTVNHYHNEQGQGVVYYELPSRPNIQPASYSYYEPVDERREVYREERPHVQTETKPKVRMFLVEGIREPLWVEGGVR